MAQQNYFAKHPTLHFSQSDTSYLATTRSLILRISLINDKKLNYSTEKNITIFFLFTIFLKSYNQCCNQEGAIGLQPSLAKPLKKFNPKYSVGNTRVRVRTRVGLEATF